MTRKEKEVLLIEEWLTTKHCTLWAVYDIVQPDTRRQAAEWLHEQITEVTNYALQFGEPE